MTEKQIESFNLKHVRFLFRELKEGRKRSTATADDFTESAYEGILEVSTDMVYTHYAHQGVYKNHVGFWLIPVNKELEKPMYFSYRELRDIYDMKEVIPWEG